MNKLTFVHCHSYQPKKTYCFRLPSYSLMEVLATTFLLGMEEGVLILETGIAHCHPKDNYSKIVGRSIAIANLETKDYKVNNVYITEKEVRINLVELVSKIQVTVILKKDLRLVKIVAVHTPKDLEW